MKPSPKDAGFIIENYLLDNDTIVKLAESIKKYYFDLSCNYGEDDLKIQNYIADALEKNANFDSDFFLSQF